MYGGEVGAIATVDHSRSVNITINSLESEFGAEKDSQARQEVLLRDMTAAFIRGLNALAEMEVTEPVTGSENRKLKRLLSELSN